MRTEKSQSRIPFLQFWNLEQNNSKVPLDNSGIVILWANSGEKHPVPVSISMISHSNIETNAIRLWCLLLSGGIIRENGAGGGMLCVCERERKNSSLLICFGTVLQLK